MTNIEIYNKAIEKATDNSKELFIPKLIVDREELTNCEMLYIIFSQEFAKAFWGEEKITINLKKDYSAFPYLVNCVSWKYHLQQMVILSDEEKFKYLEKFL